MLRLFFLFIFFLSIPCHAAAPSPEESEALITKIITKWAPVYAKYRGIETTRNFTTAVFDPETGRQTGSAKTTVRRRDYFYETPDITALAYEENNEKKEPGDCDTREIEPMFPVFDAESKKHYMLSVIDRVVFEGTDAWIIRVVPKKKNYRYFKGLVYVASDTLMPLRQVGTPAETHWAMKEFKIDYRFEQTGELFALKTGYVEARVYVFLVRPDRRYVYELKGSNHTPILR